MKKHLAVGADTRHGYLSTTLCGRAHSESDCEADNNATDQVYEVTCALCNKILATPKHWRHRKYLAPATS